MTTRRTTLDPAGTHEGALALALVFLPLVTLLAFRPASRSWEAASDAGGLIAYPLLLLAGVGFYFHWRMTGSPASAWLTVVVGVVSTVGAIDAAMRLATVAPAAPGWDTAVTPAFTLLVAVGVGTSERRVLPADPGVSTVLLSLLVCTVVFGAGAGLMAVPAPAWGPGAMAVLTVLAGLAVAVRVLRLTTLQPHALRELAVAGLLVAASQATVILPSTIALEAVQLGTVSLGVALVLAAALTMLRTSIQQASAEIGTLHERLDDAHAGARLDRERLHEIGSTLAGITSASQVIRQGAPVPVQRRERLERMVDQELQRLGRLMSTEREADTHDTSLDAALEPVVLGHQTRGRAVDWTPSGLGVEARADDVSEIVNILLENAFRHAGPGPVRLRVRETGDGVELAVADTGPGIAPDVRDRLFEWGARSGDSPGSGIGLHVARDLATRNGGSLDLLSWPAPGCTFVVRLRRSEVSRDADAHCA